MEEHKLENSVYYVVDLDNLKELTQEAFTHTGNDLVAGDMFQMVIERDGTVYGRASKQSPLNFAFESYVNDNGLKEECVSSNKGYTYFLCSKELCLVVSQVYTEQRTHECNIYMGENLTIKQMEVLVKLLSLNGKDEQKGFYSTCSFEKTGKRMKYYDPKELSRILRKRIELLNTKRTETKGPFLTDDMSLE